MAAAPAVESVEACAESLPVSLVVAVSLRGRGEIKLARIRSSNNERTQPAEQEY